MFPCVVSEASYRYLVLMRMENEGPVGTDADKGLHTVGEESDEVRVYYYRTFTYVSL